MTDESITDPLIPQEPEKTSSELEIIYKQMLKRYPETQSPEIGKLAAAMANVQSACNNGTKEKEGYGYNYQELGAVIDIIRPHLAPNGLCILQSHEYIKPHPSVGMPSVITHTTVAHSSGQWWKCSLELPIHLMKQLTVAQMIGVNCTYGRRYTLQSLGFIAAESDTDASSKV